MGTVTGRVVIRLCSQYARSLINNPEEWDAQTSETDHLERSHYRPRVVRIRVTVTILR